MLHHSKQFVLHMRGIIANNIFYICEAPTLKSTLVTYPSSLSITYTKAVHVFTDDTDDSARVLYNQ